MILLEEMILHGKCKMITQHMGFNPRLNPQLMRYQNILELRSYCTHSIKAFLDKNNGI